MKNKIVTEDMAFRKMALICSRKEYAPAEIIYKLQFLGLSHDAVGRVMSRLEKERFIEEERYIRSYVHDKLYFNHWGKKKIMLNLQKKQLPMDAVERIFSEFPTEDYDEALLSLLEKKRQSVKGDSIYDKRNKLIRYALGRGYSMDEILRCFKRMPLE